MHILHGIKSKKNNGCEHVSLFLCLGQARYLGLVGHVELTLINLKRPGESNFLKILWEYGLQSTVVSFQGLSEVSILISDQNSQGKEFHLKNSREHQADMCGFNGANR